MGVRPVPELHKKWEINDELNFSNKASVKVTSTNQSDS